MPIYIDVLIVLNGFINYLMLLCNMKLLKLNTTRLRLLLGASAGSLISLKIFLPTIPQWSDLIIRIISIFLIVICSYKFTTLNEIIKASLCFLLISFIYSGFMICVILFVNPPQLIYENGVAYYEIDFLNIVLLSAGGFFIISIVEKLFKRKLNCNYLFYTEIFTNGKSVKGRGFVDTGNTLKDPFSGKEIIVASLNAVSSVTPSEIRDYLHNKNTNKISRIRLIPITTLTGTGLLPVFIADRISIKNGNRQIEKTDIPIAVSKDKLCNGEFEFILSNIFSEEQQYADF